MRLMIYTLALLSLTACPVPATETETPVEEVSAPAVTSAPVAEPAPTTPVVEETPALAPSETPVAVEVK